MFAMTRKAWREFVSRIVPAPKKPGVQKTGRMPAVFLLVDCLSVLGKATALTKSEARAKLKKSHSLVGLKVLSKAEYVRSLRRMIPLIPDVD